MNMKHIYLIIISLCITAGASAQSLTLSNVHISSDVSTPTLLEGEARVTNNSNAPINVMVERVLNNFATGHESYFCWVQCYPDFVSVSPDPINIAGGGGFADDFKGDVETYGIPGISEVAYCFYDQNNISDSVCVKYTFDFTTGIPDIPSSINYISKASPNPAGNYTSFYYNKENPSSEASIKIFNVLGSQVKNITLRENRSSIKVDVTDLRAGLYFYSMFVDGKNISSGKLLVNRN
jgi:hypothetical protein